MVEDMRSKKERVNFAIEIEGVCFGNESKRRMWLGKVNKRVAREVYRNYV